MAANLTIIEPIGSAPYALTGADPGRTMNDAGGGSPRDGGVA